MMDLIKVKSEKTFKDKNGKERNVIFYALRFDSGKYIPIKPIFEEGYALLDFNINEFIDNSKKKSK